MGMLEHDPNNLSQSVNAKIARMNPYSLLADNPRLRAQYDTDKAAGAVKAAKEAAALNRIRNQKSKTKT